ncbi:S-methyl-5-thioribose-1-phosphate isomerase [Methylobacterium nodulans]|uniref:Methylthioribose-1-phosphate isomerase n=1 Tax=Methylobacterium nodulans (strain LMG 21967 / CNCM I-2342 / ORS 2060) TaxID=460265 RepID=MTNA_METNO|nr:S-methyl-5-thioribose-1-phosphate isomerase [Methylobacterium nodulans]B8IEX1.1 RecName: Full=Methylthioribose-1-phosphate isomerase; Short=M1Pi; Short=MTR-1-P isomerase; AltName: Full=S-methyl-5-thioribose-1-phosphate isomerase [Methylobacterium nodulans ORS 2060]ACL61464.1 translation initiation factor, aIF-2BI family [Methylobacterium nodulans ORS 2060]
MKIDGRPYRTIFPEPGGDAVCVIDQTRLPFAFEIRRLTTAEEAAEAIRTMVVRGAPLIGVTAAYGLALGLRRDPSDAGLERIAAMLAATRPTAVNLRWALERLSGILRPLPPDTRAPQAFAEAGRIAEEDVANCRAIGEHGARLIAQTAAKGRRVNVLTHCNAGWLATVDWGTALAPIYVAHDAGVPVHVFVDETRPRNQGAALTAFELNAHGVPHTVVADNAGGHLMQHGGVDLCIVGSDRTTSTGDVCNKIGTYLKALAAFDNGVPFYAALPVSTIDWTLTDGVAGIPIEERDGREVTHLTGRTEDGGFATIQVVSPGSPVANPAFDVTPARLVTGLITERGVAEATEEGLLRLYPERRKAA